MSGTKQSQRQNVPPASGVDAPQIQQSNIWDLLMKMLRSIAIGLILQQVFIHAGSYIKAPLREDFAKPESIKSSEEDHSRAQDPSQTWDYSAIPRNVLPLWTSPARIDIDLYISADRDFNRLGMNPFISERNIQIGDWEDTRRVSRSLEFSDDVLKNGSLYAHIFTYKSPASIQRPSDPTLSNDFALQSVHVLTRYMPKRRNSEAKRLLAGLEDANPSHEPEAGIISYYHPNFTLSVVGDAGTLPLDKIHATIRPYVVLEPSNLRDTTGLDGYYLPIMYENDFWLLQDHMYPINSSVTRVPFNLEINQVTLMKMQIFKSLDQAVKQQTDIMGGSGGEIEEVKRILLETNVWLLGVTVSVNSKRMHLFSNEVSSRSRVFTPSSKC